MLVGSGNNLEDMKNQELHFESLKVQDVRYESASQRRCLDKDVYFESAALKWRLYIKGYFSANP